LETLPGRCARVIALDSGLNRVGKAFFELRCAEMAYEKDREEAMQLHFSRAKSLAATCTVFEDPDLMNHPEVEEFLARSAALTAAIEGRTLLVLPPISLLEENLPHTAKMALSKYTPGKKPVKKPEEGAGDSEDDEESDIE
jgi:hypothetical protein